MKKTMEGRRGFLKGSLTAGAGMLVASAVPASIQAAEPHSNSGCKKYSFDTPPAPIPASAIKSKKTADVVVLGCGVSGLCAAMSAASAGAKVILLEKRNTFTTHGGANGVMDSRAHRRQDITIPRDKVMADLMRFGAYRVNPDLHRVWANESGRVMDKLLDLADAEGVNYFVPPIGKVEHWPYIDFPLPIIFLPGINVTLCEMLMKKCQALGVEMMFETPAEQLIRKDNKSKVTGVIAKGKEGYVRVDANKGVIICTGGYTHNTEMHEKYSPRVLKVCNKAYFEGSDTGDGILMGMWAGGVKQETDCPMLWDGELPGGDGMFISIARQPFLYVNTLGKRYMNEEAPFGYVANGDLMQPGCRRWTVWDANWDDDKEKFHSVACKDMHSPIFWNDKSYEKWKAKGKIIEANTIEELGKKMGVPVDTFVASVKRYNEMAAKGFDDDYGKNPAMMTSILKPPFGATLSGTAILVTVDGLRINTDMQVLDAESKPIPGLYAAGNASGDFFANDYPITSGGVSHGRALTFGWLAGEKAAAL